MQSVSERIAGWVAGLGWDDVPERVKALARHQTMSVLAALHAGVDDEAAQQVERVALAGAASGPCTALPTGEKLPIERALLLSSARSMALDFDDYLYMGHTGHSAVLGAWALAEELGRSAKDVLLAQIIANEVGARVGTSAVLGPQNGQAWSFIHAAEGAVLGSKLLGLDAAKTAHALGIALYQPTFTLWPGFMGPGSKVLTAAGPTLTGIQAARLAAEGMTGAREIFEHPTKGFWSAFSFVPLPHVMTGFGSAWLSDTLTFKRYPGCAYIDTTLDALFEVMERFAAERGRPLAPDDVAGVRVEASLLTIEMDRLSREHVGARLSPINVNFSIPFNVGIAIVAGRHSSEELRQGFLDRHETAIRALAKKTRLRHDVTMSLDVAAAFDTVLGSASIARQLAPRDWLKVALGWQRTIARGTAARPRDGRRRRPRLRLGATLAALRRLGRFGAERSRSSGAGTLDGVDFQAFRMCFPAKVTLELADGTQLSARQDVPFGAPGQARHLEAAVEKLRVEAGRRLGGEGASMLVERVRGFEQQPLDELTRLTCRPRAAL